jgi:sporulation protein YlmC with PRC-barrel domain
MSGAEVSWKAIEKGARVIASDGEEIGRVAEMAGDSEADIFSGLVVSMSRLGRNRFLPAERVRAIWPDRVETSLTVANAEQLEEYSDPVAERWQPSEGGFLSRIFRRRR